jgi:hypothetical protein
MQRLLVAVRLLLLCDCSSRNLHPPVRHTGPFDCRYGLRSDHLHLVSELATLFQSASWLIVTKNPHEMLASACFMRLLVTDRTDRTVQLGLCSIHMSTLMPVRQCRAARDSGHRYHLGGNL